MNIIWSISASCSLIFRSSSSCSLVSSGSTYGEGNFILEMLGVFTCTLIFSDFFTSWTWGMYGPQILAFALSYICLNSLYLSEIGIINPPSAPRLNMSCLTKVKSVSTGTGSPQSMVSRPVKQSSKGRSSFLSSNTLNAWFEAAIEWFLTLLRTRCWKAFWVITFSTLCWSDAIVLFAIKNDSTAKYLGDDNKTNYFSIFGLATYTFGGYDLLIYITDNKVIF